MITFVLFFAICGASPGLDACEEGHVAARSCEAAEAYIRAGLRPGQTLHVTGCEAA